MKQSLRSSKYFKCETLSITNSTSDIFLNNYSNYPIRLNNDKDNIIITTGYENVSMGSNNIVLAVLDNMSAVQNDCINITNYPDPIAQSDGSIVIGTKITGNVASINIGENSVCIGNGAGLCNNSSNTIAIGYLSGNSNKEKNSVSIGVNASAPKQGENSICIGNKSGQSGGQEAECITIGTFSAMSQKLKAITLGSYNISAEDSISLGTQGRNSICIGAKCFNDGPQLDDAICIGTISSGKGQENMSITLGSWSGYGGIANENSITLGTFKTYKGFTGSNSISIGSYNDTPRNDNVITIGNRTIHGDGESDVNSPIYDCISIGHDIGLNYKQNISNILVLNPYGDDTGVLGTFTPELSDSGGLFINCEIGASNIGLPSLSNNVAFYNPYTYEIFLSEDN